MNGAESLVRALKEAGIEVCFANPGTSEMHFVAALDQVGGVRCVLGLFEGVVTGAADGYARMKGKPAVTLLHLGPGLANGIANLHNARKANVAIVNIVGEHASWHIEHDAPLTSDIEGLARPVSHWLRTAEAAVTLATDGAAAVAAANLAPGRIATLIVPANTAWETTPMSPADTMPVAQPTPTVPATVEAGSIAEIARVLRGNERVAIVLGSVALREDALLHAARIAMETGASLYCETFKTRMQRGAGRVAVDAIPYPVKQAVALLEPFDRIVTVGARSPIAFFAYPDLPSELFPASASVHSLATVEEDALQALVDLENTLAAGKQEPELQILAPPERCADGPLTPDALANVISRLLPADAIIVDESITAGRGIFAATRSAAPHDWLEVCGGSIGGGLPLAAGAAIACPERQVICLEGDGSAMYTLQALWTQAREELNVVTIILANQSYEILKHELDNVQAIRGAVATSMMELDRPALDWVSLARGMGVFGVRAETVAELEAALAQALTASGPRLIEARL